MQLAFGGLLGPAVIAGMVVAVLIGRGGESKGPSSVQKTAANVKLPQQQTSDIKAAAKAAGCTLANPPFEGATHEQKTFKPSDYRTNPPTSGNHTPDWYQD